MPRRTPRIDLAYWYVDFATSQLRKAEESFKKINFPEAIDSFQDSIEFAIKAIFEFAGISYPTDHDLTSLIPNLIAAFSGFAQEFSRAAVVSSRWLGRARNIPRYGNQDLGVAPRTLYTKTEVRQALSNAKEIYCLLLKIVKKQKLRPPTKIALLNGFVEGPRYRETPCGTRPFSNFDGNHWKNAFEAIQLPNGTRKYNVNNITASEISNEYAMIINPFGEAYPENDVELRPIFSKIKDYVWSGGVFVSAGGFAFFYAWNVRNGQTVPISESRTLIPSAIAVHQPTGQLVVQQYRSALEFTGTLLWKELGALTTGGESFNMQIRQNCSDRNKVGNLRVVGGSSIVQEFRGLRDETRNIVPLLRGDRPDFGNVYPIAAIKYGYGYFLICGMNLVTNVEFEKSKVAADRFLKWFLAQN